MRIDVDRERELELVAKAQAGDEKGRAASTESGDGGILVDLDGDGYADMAAYDNNADGIVDHLEVDAGGDGYYDQEQEITTENIAPDMPTTDQLGYGGANAGYEDSYGDDAPTDIA
ncbi:MULTISPECIES: hypothetical protein [unclassified Corynebacterium]|uniref:hypothetical protein n=1 Tax=unclassified Corynebacterium TaxID=2624378 RepID=UPI00265CBC2A|nr:MULTISPECIES: hypothetical protein [unclassified Corynebacterium]WKK55572.1 hypothetical protein QYR03_10475 [Corynebacterium sp. P4-C1]WKK62982.1 hypothetical protein QYR04_09170 [Corynebacterium sp. P8-C1]